LQGKGLSVVAYQKIAIQTSGAFVHFQKKGQKIMKVGMQFAQPATRCRICLWKSRGIPFRALTILEHSRTSIYGLAAKMLALNTSRNFDGRKASFAQVAEKSLASHP
jgi:hypothetical protein